MSIARQQNVGYNSRPYSHDVSYFKLNETSSSSSATNNIDNNNHDDSQRPVPVNGKIFFCEIFFVKFFSFY